MNAIASVVWIRDCGIGTPQGRSVCDCEPQVFEASDRTRILVANVDVLGPQECGTVTQCPDKYMRRVLRAAAGVERFTERFVMRTTLNACRNQDGSTMTTSKQHNTSAPPANVVNAAKLREWQRHHHDGSHGFVKERKPGIFVAIDVVPFGTRRAPTGANREFTTIEDACLTADCAAEWRGHTCTPACTRWRRQ
jgi:hypothetical protein